MSADRRFDAFRVDELVYLRGVLSQQDANDGSDHLYDEVLSELERLADEEHDREAIEAVYGDPLDVKS